MWMEEYIHCRLYGRLSLTEAALVSKPWGDGNGSGGGPFCDLFRYVSALVMEPSAIFRLELGISSEDDGKIRRD